MKPNKENIRLWVEALRSGKYTQGRGRLKTDVGFCCLGVACDISGLSTWEQAEKNEGKVYHYDHAVAILPLAVREWLGIDSLFVSISNGGQYWDLAAMNDGGKKFGEIADLIEKEYLSEDK